MTIRNHAVLLTGLLVGLGLVGCGLLYGPFTGLNPDHCSNNPSVCSGSERCDTRTGFCVHAAADMTLSPDLMPSVTAIAPQRGPAATATMITITGTNFKAGATVTIGGIAATAVMVVSNTSITAMTGASPRLYGPQDVVVKNSDASAAATVPKGYTYFIGTPGFAVGFNANTAALSGNGPFSIANIDLTGQGFPSIVTGMDLGNVFGTLAQGINIIPNTTTSATPTAPTFATPIGIPTGGTNVGTAVVGDMDGNGLLDVVTANFGLSTVSVVHRMAAGALTVTLIPTATGNFNKPAAVIVGDFDKDGKVNDFAASNLANGTVSILKNNGNMTYSPIAGSPFDMTTGAAGYKPAELGVGDFDGDGRDDLVVGNNAGSAFLRILLNKATGFEVQPVLAASVINEPHAFAPGDFDGDGKLDFMLVNRLPTGLVSFYKGDGVGGFTKPNADMTVGTTPQSIASGDLNRDGFLDVVVANPGSLNLHYMLGKGDGTFQAPVLISTGVASYGVTIGDYNQDGRPDIAIGDHTVGNVVILLNIGM